MKEFNQNNDKKRSLFLPIDNVVKYILFREFVDE